MRYLFTFLAIAISFLSIAETKSSFKSSIDDSLLIKRVAIISFTDNVKGIYSKKAEDRIQEMLNSDSQWSLVEHALNYKSDSVEGDTATIKKIIKSLDVQGLFVSHLTRGPRGINARLVFYVGGEGLEFAREVITDSKDFNLDKIKDQYSEMLLKIKNKMPYQGLILSRKNLDVTINLGQKDGLKKGDDVFVIQFIEIKRHPKHSYVVGNEKFILGKVKLLKVDDSMSFGKIFFEREGGAVQPQAKVIADTFKKYSEPITNVGDAPIENLDQRAESQLAFGKEPQEWKPLAAPQYGSIQLLAGISQFSQTSDLTSGENITVSNSFAPNIEFGGELWLNQDWWGSLKLSQSVFSVSNGYSNSSPGTLNVSTSQYDILFGYTHYLLDELIGPKLKFGLGISQYSIHADTSTPVAMTNTNIGGMFLSAAFIFPIRDVAPADLFAQFDWHYNPTTSESGLNSGVTASSSISQFSFGGRYNYRQKISLIGRLDLDYYSTTFTGTGTRGAGATSISSRSTAVFAGMEFLY